MKRKAIFFNVTAMFFTFQWLFFLTDAPKPVNSSGRNDFNQTTDFNEKNFTSDCADVEATESISSDALLSTMACNDDIQVSMDPNCQALITPDMILEGTYPDLSQYTVSLKTTSGATVPNPITGAYIGKVIIATVRHTPSGNTCWGRIHPEDKLGPFFVCPTDTIRLTCNEDPSLIPPPVALDNCDPAPQVNLVNETVIPRSCGDKVIIRTFRATDRYNNPSAGVCTQIIRITQPPVNFPDDITWTCEQYAAFKNIIDPQPLHNCILQNATALDAANLYCMAGLHGNDVPGIAPYQAGTAWWTDGEDLDVPLDPAYDDNIDNPLTDPNPSQCGTASAERDDQPDICNLSIFVGCPYTSQCTIPGTHIPTIITVPIHNPATIRGLEDADVLAATGSGVPNASGYAGCSFAVTWTDTRLAACDGVSIDISFKILRTWTVLNWCTGQVLTDVQIIKVIDKKGPVIVFNDDDNNNGVPDELQTNETYGNNDGFNDQLVANQVISVGGHSDCGSQGLLDVPQILDNCTGIQEIRVLTPAGPGIPVYNGGVLIGFRIPYPYLPLGVHNITYKAVDGCGNTTTAVKRVEVIDGIPPVPICRELTQIALSSADGGITSIDAKYFNEGSYDNCGPVYFKVLKMVENTCNKANIDKPGEITANHEWFDDKVIFCCSDIQYNADGSPKPINVILRVYDVDPGAGAIPTVRANANNPNNLSHNASYGYLNNNHYNDCMIQVLVEDKVRPICTPPADVWTTCAAIPSNVNLQDTLQLQSYFGKATYRDNCSATTQELAPTVNVDLCGVGTVIRNFRAKDISGNLSLGVCRQVVNIMQVTSYEINIPGDFEGECTNARPDTLTYTEAGCDLLAVNVEDKEFLASPNGECKKILRTYKIINWCEYDGFSAATVIQRRDLNRDGLVGDGFTPLNPQSKYRSNYRLISNGNFVYLNTISDPTTRVFPSTGYYQYEQHIKIYDDTAPELRDTLSGPFCGGDRDEDPCTGQVNLLPFINETCTGVTISWQLDLDNNGSFDLTGTNALQGRFPLGRHRVRFRVSDQCGNTSQLDITFDIIDCKAPTPVCYNGLSVNLMPTGMVALWASDFDASSFDYCHPLKFRINRITDLDGDGFITAADYQTTPPAYDSIIARCKDRGVLYVQFWVGEVSNDNVNNWDYCVTFVEVQDNNNACNGPGSKSIGGKIANEQGESVAMVHVDLSTGARTMTGNDGKYQFNNLSTGGDFTVAPNRDDDALNGVSTFDLVQISKHILNVAPLNSPYKIIAADANNSRSVTTLDLVALRKLILRVEDKLPNNTSWRFVEKNYHFPNPANPWQGVFPEVKSYNNLSVNQLNTEFVAIKVGDVNGSARYSNLTGTDNRIFPGKFTLKAEEQLIEAGEIVEVPFVATSDVEGYQFTLNYEQEALDVLEIREGVATKEHFHEVASHGQITTSWNGNGKIAGEVMFTLVLRAKTKGKISNWLNIGSTPTKEEAFSADGEMMGVAIEFGGNAPIEGFSLLSNTPNPFNDQTSIRFNLPEAAFTTLTFTDVNGKILKVISGNFGKGHNEIILKKADINEATGVIFYDLKTERYKATGSMVRIK